MIPLQECLHRTSHNLSNPKAMLRQTFIRRIQNWQTTRNQTAWRCQSWLQYLAASSSLLWSKRSASYADGSYTCGFDLGKETVWANICSSSPNVPNMREAFDFCMFVYSKHLQTIYKLQFTVSQWFQQKVCSENGMLSCCKSPGPLVPAKRFGWCDGKVYQYTKKTVEEVEEQEVEDTKLRG